MANQRQSARHSDSRADGKERQAPVLNESREILGTRRIHRDPFIDGEVEDLPKSRLNAADSQMLTDGYKLGSFEVKNKYGPDHRGDMPQLGERTKASHEQTVIKHRSLK